jgi:3-oxoacyl-[acyl-carrier protein] reductase/pteridine reductase
MPTINLSGKVALVTGGARRIGRAICRELASADAAVALTWYNSSREALELAEELQHLGVGALAVECDVRSEDSVQRAVELVTATLGRLDILVNNAAVFEAQELADLSVNAWDRVFETNTRGPFLMARAALPHLKAAQGRIVNIGSLGGLRPWATHAHYCASKAALHALTQSMARAFAPEISVNCVAPGFIDFAENRDALAARLAERTPLQRNGSAEDVAAAVRFFAAGPAFVTGQILAVDGGLGLV